MNAPSTDNQRWRKILQTPVSQLLRGQITGPQSPLEQLDTASLPDAVVESIRAITDRLSGRFQFKAARQLVKSSKAVLQEGCAESQLVEQLSEPESIAALIQVTGKTDWILQTPLPARMWPTVSALVGQKHVRKSAARKVLSHVCRSFQWQLDAGRTPEALIEANGDAISLGGLLYETKSVAPLLDFSLPESLSSVVLDVVRQTRLWPEEKLDTARELCAHFADGLEQGETEDALIKSFGSPKTTARLIRRARLRNRPFAWRARRRTWQTMVILMIAVLVPWSVLTVRFLVAKPTITFDLIQEADDLSRAVPRQERAWPLYLQGFSKYTKDDQAQFGKLRLTGLMEGPASEDWPDAKEFLKKYVAVVELYLQATRRPKLGFINRPNVNDLGKYRELNRPFEVNAVDKEEIYILLPQTQELSFKVVPLLNGAIYLAAEEGDGERCLQLLRARINVASHYRQTGPYVICQIGANGLIGSAAQLAQQIVVRYPDLFTDKQLTTLFQKIKDTPIKPLDFEPSKRWIENLIQNSYTDDGNGNGRFTLRGFQILSDLADGSPEKQKWLQSVIPALLKQNTSQDPASSSLFQAIAGPLATRIADRKEMQRELLYLNQLLWEARIEQSDAAKTAYMSEYLRLLESPQSRLKYIYALMILPYSESTDYWTSTDQASLERVAALTIIAAEQYRREHGQFPQTIEALVPQYFAQVPLDPFTHKPLPYAVKDERPVIESARLKNSGEE
ncbi:hypothetical protein Pan241w_00630 [Gimesia alba]|uniref:Uncharacterized protein n=1 Tax=Gimesia alba TaxID=2527973 RepID=A0A517R7Z3_9PLAN|nr:hypothetical protein [Gimesia alba]QDT40010.1 hypothetical protein Pan241w_00630 [Gimesia alba]